MADSDNFSPDLSPDASVTVSPAESVKEQFDPCATTTDVPINATSTSVGLEEPDFHNHPNLSTLRLLFAHIGYVNFIYYVHISWPIHSAALTLFLATTDAVRNTEYFSMSCLIDLHRQLSPRVFQQLSVTYKDLKFNTHG
jgi:hypothetical protein